MSQFSTVSHEELETVAGSGTFVPHDRPERLTEPLAGFLSRRAAR
ncbi:hypothetical protein [Actinomadura sp. NAK00032]|nr:hypothetical protein [Actinomadura sp. NAK00032]